MHLWLLLNNDIAPQTVAATPPLYYWVATATAWLTASFLPLADGARLASGMFVALALFFTARSARVLYGAETGWAAALTLLGCIGLLVRGHELNAATAQFAAAAVMLYGIARMPQATRGGWALGVGAVLMLLAGGAAEAALFLLLAWLLPLLLVDYRTPAARRTLIWGTLIALAASALWLAYLATQSIPFVRAFNLQRWVGDTARQPAYYPGILGWYAWPAWPLALWALYRGRRQWRTPGIVLPTGVLLGLLILYAFDAHPGEEQGLILLLPLALLGATGLFSLRRGAAYALLWFSVMLFGFIALLLWVYWSAHDLGTPARLAARLTRFGMLHVGELRPWTLVLGVIVTLLWIGILARLPRSPLRPMLVWTASMTFVWVLADEPVPGTARPPSQLRQRQPATGGAGPAHRMHPDLSGAQPATPAAGLSQRPPVFARRRQLQLAADGNPPPREPCPRRRPAGSNNGTALVPATAPNAFICMPDTEATVHRRRHSGRRPRAAHGRSR